LLLLDVEVGKPVHSHVDVPEQGVVNVGLDWAVEVFEVEVLVDEGHAELQALEEGVDLSFRGALLGLRRIQAFDQLEVSLQSEVGVGEAHQLVNAVLQHLILVGIPQSVVAAFLKGKERSRLQSWILATSIRSGRIVIVSLSDLVVAVSGI
jgi:hypothetical protein